MNLRKILYFLLTILLISTLFINNYSVFSFNTDKIVKTSDESWILWDFFDSLSQWEMIVVIEAENQKGYEQEGDYETKVVLLPLKHTSVNWEISGFVARTTIIQEFWNPYDEAIEAIYNFPLPNEASVDSMVMKIGDREIIWKIEKREIAEELYKEAKQAWKTASLLNQERPNIFTQKIANILPWDIIKIEISYFQTLKYESWEYKYEFPMVVWPRYNPESVKDSENITSPIISKDSRNGHTIDISLKINSWVNIEWLNSPSHDIEIKKINNKQAEITLKNKNEIPNKDFIFTYKVASDIPQIGILTHKDKNSDHGYFTLIAEPQVAPKKEEIRNKEIVFVLDTSWSMSGMPIIALRKAMIKAIEGLWENDYFNIYSFNSSLTKMFDKSVKANNKTKQKWLSFVDWISAWGWTVMDEPLREALKEDWNESDRMRIILILTDWDVWNENELLKLVKNNIWENRIFTLWVDYSPNRFLLDRISEAWNWKTTYILPDEDVDEKVEEFYETFKSPVLTNIKIDWDWLNVSDTLPTHFSDLYAGQPLYIYWKYSWEFDKKRDIKIKGIRWNDEYSQTVFMIFKDENKDNSSLAWLWARKKVKDIYSENYFNVNSKLEEEVTKLWLDYSIMTKFTSFIAIDDNIRNNWWKVETIQVPKYEIEGKNYNSYESVKSRWWIMVDSAMLWMWSGNKWLSIMTTWTTWDNSSNSRGVIHYLISYLVGILYIIAFFTWLTKLFNTFRKYKKEKLVDIKKGLKKRMVKISWYTILTLFIIFLFGSIINVLLNFLTVF